MWYLLNQLELSIERLQYSWMIKSIINPWWFLSIKMDDYIWWSMCYTIYIYIHIIIQLIVMLMTPLPNSIWLPLTIYSYIYNYLFILKCSCSSFIQNLRQPRHQGLTGRTGGREDFQEDRRSFRLIQDIVQLLLSQWRAMGQWWDLLQHNRPMVEAEKLGLTSFNQN